MGALEVCRKHVLARNLELCPWRAARDEREQTTFAPAQIEQALLGACLLARLVAFTARGGLGQEGLHY